MVDEIIKNISETVEVLVYKIEERENKIKNYKEDIQNKKIYACCVLQEIYEVLAFSSNKTFSKNAILGLLQNAINENLGGLK